MSNLLPTICRMCGAQLFIDESKVDCECRFCRTKYILKDFTVRSGKKVRHAVGAKVLICPNCGTFDHLKLYSGKNIFACEICRAKICMKLVHSKPENKASRVFWRKLIKCKYCGEYEEIIIAEDGKSFGCRNCGAQQRLW